MSSLVSAEEMRELCERATNGAWRTMPGRPCLVEAEHWPMSIQSQFSDDAEFIAAAREFVPWAIKRMEQVMEENERLCGLIRSAEFADNSDGEYFERCPWCESAERTERDGKTWAVAIPGYHAPDCPIIDIIKQG